MTLAEKLIELGFADDAEAKGVAEANAEAQNMSAGGAYNVRHVFTKGSVIVTVEQNNAPEDLGGLTAVVEHPPVAIVQSPKGRAACNPDDVDLVVAVINDLS